MGYNASILRKKVIFSMTFQYTFGARDENRTHTGIPYAPQTYASTSSATRATFALDYSKK